MHAHDVFAEFYAVVLEHPAGGPLRWSPGCQGWVRYAGHGWADTAVAGDAVDEQQLTAAIEVVNAFVAERVCQECGVAATGELHYVSVDVVGAPVISCLQLPAFHIVDSAKGSGRLKHWGSPFGCDAVGGPALLRGEVAGFGRDVMAGFVYGRPLSARQVLERPWCSRCRRAARNVFEEHVDEVGAEGNRDFEVHRSALRRLARLLEQAAG